MTALPSATSSRAERAEHAGAARPATGAAARATASSVLAAEGARATPRRGRTRRRAMIAMATRQRLPGALDQVDDGQGDQHRHGRLGDDPQERRAPTGRPRCRRRPVTRARGAAAGPRRAARAARMRDIREKAASAAASRKATSGWRAPPRVTSRGHGRGPAASGARAAAGGEEGEQQLALQLEHLLLLLRLRVVVAEQVQDAVRGEQQQLLLGGVAGLARPAAPRRSGRARCRRARPPRAPGPRGRGAARPSGSS